MEKCPRFIDCSIPKCPLDEHMNQRPEFDEDKICPLRRITEKKRKNGRLKGIVLSAKMKSLRKLVPSKNFKKS